VERRRSRQALIRVIQEAFINGVTTRKVERLAKALRIEGMSASQVSEITRGLDEQVDAFRNRALEVEYPVMWVDALYQKIRVNGRVVSSAVKESFVRLVTAFLIEYSKKWSVGRSYIKSESIDRERVWLGRAA
jgi:transposase-like protein